MMRRVLWNIALAVLTTLGIRFVWTVAAAETGPGIVIQHFRQLVPRMLGRQYLPVFERDPEEQAEFWLGEIERISAEQPLSAAESLGAAWILHEPARGFWRRNIRFPVPDLAHPIAALVGPRLDQDAIDRMTRVFEERCRETSLSLADSATDREPSNPDWWRLSAFLRFGSINGSRLTSLSIERDLEWLERARAHDPEDGLYDLIGALLLFHSSATIDWTSDLPVLQVRDARRYAEIDQFLSRLTSRPLRDSTRVQQSAVDEFLHLTALPVHERIECGAIECKTLLAMLLRDFGRWQEVRSQDLAAGGAFAAASDCWTQLLDLVDRTLDADELLGSDLVLLRIRLFALANLVKLRNEHPESLSYIEFQAIRQRQSDSRLESGALNEAVRRYSATIDPNTLKSSSSESSGLVAAGWMLLVGGLGLLAWRWLQCVNETHPSPLGFGQHLFTDLLAWTFGFILLGIGMPPIPVENALPKETSLWLRAGLRWANYPSIPFSLAGSILIVGLWSIVREARFRRESCWGFLTEGPRGRWACVARNVANSALGLATAGLLIYLIITPLQISRIEVRTQALLSLNREPDRVADALTDISDAIRKEPDTMQRIRSEVDLD